MGSGGRDRIICWVSMVAVLRAQPTELQGRIRDALSIGGPVILRKI